VASKYPPDQSSTGQKEPDQEVIERETLLEFPCKFPIKAMGRNEASFQTLVESIVLNHAEIYADEPVTTNPSSTGKYLSITVTVEAQSRDQLDRIYQDLTDCEQVLVAL
jgi:putative lipoic acid-binding regulatory protein